MRESSVGDRKDSHISFLQFLIKSDADHLRRFEKKNQDSLLSKFKQEEEQFNRLSEVESDQDEPKIEAQVIEFAPQRLLQKATTSETTTEDFEDKLNMSTGALLTLHIHRPQTQTSLSQAHSTAGSATSPSQDYRKKYSKKKRVSSKKRTKPTQSFKEEGEIILKTEQDLWG